MHRIPGIARLSFGTAVELFPRMRMVAESLLLVVASDDRCAISFHGAVSDFKRRLIEASLAHAHGNRTHAARALGLQRTYLLRLIRELGVAAPPPPPRRGTTPM